MVVMMMVVLMMVVMMVVMAMVVTAMVVTAVDEGEGGAFYFDEHGGFEKHGGPKSAGMNYGSELWHAAVNIIWFVRAEGGANWQMRGACIMPDCISPAADSGLHQRIHEAPWLSSGNGTKRGCFHAHLYVHWLCVAIVRYW